MRQIGTTLISFFILFYAGFSSHLCAQSSKLDFLMEKASKAFDEQDYKMASRVLRAVIKKQPGYDPARILMGAIHYEKGNDSKAKKLFDKVDVKAVTPQVAFAWGAIYYKNEILDKAESGFRKVPKMPKRNRAYAEFYLGAIAIKNNDFRLAKRYLKQVDYKLLSKKLRKARRLFAERIRNRKNGNLWAASIDFSTVNESKALSEDYEYKAFEFQKPEVKNTDSELADIDKEQDDNVWQTLISPHLSFYQDTREIENAKAANSQLSVRAHRELVSLELSARPSNISLFESESFGVRGTFGNAGYEANTKSENNLTFTGSSASVIQQVTKSFGENNLYTNLSLFGNLKISSDLTLDTVFDYHQLWAGYGLENGLEALKADLGLKYQMGSLMLQGKAFLAYQNDKLEQASFFDITSQISLELDLSWALLSGFIEYLIVSGDRYQTVNTYRYVINGIDLRPADLRTSSFRGGLGMEIPQSSGSILVKADFLYRTFAQDEYPKRMYQSDPVENGAITSINGEVDYKWNLLRGLSLHSSAFAKYLMDYYSEIELEASDLTLVTTDGFSLGAKLGLEFVPYNWLVFKIASQYASVSFNSLSTSEEQIKFNSRNPSLVAGLFGFASLNLSF